MEPFNYTFFSHGKKITLSLQENDDSANHTFEPKKGEELTLQHGNQTVTYGTSEYRVLVRNLRLPDFQGKNLYEWVKNYAKTTPEVRKFLENGSHDLSFGQTLEIGAQQCLLTIKDFRGGVTQIVDKGCDLKDLGEADAAAMADAIKKASEDKAAMEGTELLLMSARLMRWATRIKREEAPLVFSSGLGRIDTGGGRSLSGQIVIGTPPNELKEKPKQRSGKEGLAIHFDTAMYELTDQSKENLDAFVENNRGAREWLIEGYADVRGDIAYNYDLGRNRAKAVSDYLQQQWLIPAYNIHIISYGESRSRGESAEAMQRDRRVVILPDEDPLVRALTLVGKTKGVYLFDASTSMFDHINTIRSFSYPVGSQLYEFNSCSGMGGSSGIVRPIENPAHYSICGGTPLWESVLSLVTTLKGRTGLTIVTDGEAHDPPMDMDDGAILTSDEVIRIAKAKGIRIHIINMSRASSTEEATKLMNVAHQTGGSHYLMAGDSYPLSGPPPY